MSAIFSASAPPPLPAVVVPVGTRELLPDELPMLVDPGLPTATGARGIGRTTQRSRLGGVSSSRAVGGEELPVGRGTAPETLELIPSAPYVPIARGDVPRHDGREYLAAKRIPVITPGADLPEPAGSAIFRPATMEVETAATVVPVGEPKRDVIAGSHREGVVKNRPVGERGVVGTTTTANSLEPADLLAKPEGVADWSGLTASLGAAPNQDAGARKTVLAAQQQAAAQQKARTEESMKVVAALTRNSPVLAGWDERMAEALSLMPSVQSLG